MKRFQESNKIVQFWRYRWYLLIPFKWFYYMYIQSFIVLNDTDVNDIYKPRGKNLWKLLKGIAQGNMKWHYTSEEVFEHIEKKWKRKEK